MKCLGKFYGIKFHLQKWHKKGRGDKISIQPVMEVTISKTKRDETKTQEEVKCVLYDARSTPSMILMLK